MFCVSFNLSPIFKVFLKRRNCDCPDATLDIEENAQLGAKIETLRKKVTELKATNETLIAKKNRAHFELGLSKEDLKVVRSLLEAAQKDLSLDQDGKLFSEEIASQLLS